MQNLKTRNEIADQVRNDGCVEIAGQILNDTFQARNDGFVEIADQVRNDGCVEIAGQVPQ